MTLASIGTFGADWVDLDRPFSGNWTARARLDIGADAAPALGASSIVFDTGAATIEYVGTIIDVSEDEGDGWVTMIGGSGGLRKELPGEDYDKPPPRLVVAAILSAAGERQGDLSALAPLPRITPFYSRLAGPASRQLDAVCSLVGARWRVRPSGVVDAGPALWLPYDGDSFVIHLPDAHGVALAEPDLPDLEPGMTVTVPLAGETRTLRVSRVRYFVTEDGLSARLWTEAT